MKSINISSTSIICGDVVALRRLLRWVTDAFLNQALELPALISGRDLASASIVRVLPNLQLLFTSQHDWVEYSKKRAKFFVLESRPFAKEETVNWVNRIREQVKESSILVVLMEQPHREGYTDITNSGDDLSEAQRLFRQKCIDTMVLTERENLGTGMPDFVMNEFLDLLNWEEDWDLSWEKCCGDLLDIIEYITDPQVFSDEFRIILEESAPETKELSNYLGVCGDISMTQIISYKSLVLHHKDTIWENYSAELERRMFPKNQQGGIYPIINWFRDIMEKDYIPGWNAKQDAEMLTQLIRGELQTYLKKARISLLLKQQQREQIISALCTEEDYKRMVSEKSGPDSHIQVDFPGAVRTFVNDRLPKLIYDRLKARASIIKTAYSRYQQAG